MNKRQPAPAAGEEPAAPPLPKALRRYLYLLMHAEEVANQAVCPECQTYGRLAVVHDDSRTQRVGARCKQCGHDWPIAGRVRPVQFRRVCRSPSR